MIVIFHQIFMNFLLHVENGEEEKLINHEFFFLPRVCSLLLRRRFAFSGQIMNTTDPHLITNATQELVFFADSTQSAIPKLQERKLKGNDLK